MSTNRSKKMMELVQSRSRTPETETQDKVGTSVPSTGVTMLADVTNKAENQRYLNVQDYLKTSESASVSNENHLSSSKVADDCSDERHSNVEHSDVDFSDQDPTYNIPKKKIKPIPVYPSHQSTSSRRSSSSSSSSSTSSSSGTSKDSSDIESCQEQNKEQTNPIQVPEENQFDQRTIDEPATTEVLRNQGNTTPIEEVGGNKKGRKRKRNVESWKQNKAKCLRNAGKRYTTKKLKTIEPRSVKPPCGVKCRLKCCEKITADQRQVIFNAYWELGQVNAQRSFIMSCMSDITPRYKYTNACKPRKCNKAFHFIVQGKSVRVCKPYFISTLDISDRIIRTVKDKTDENGLLVKDLRGHHINHVRVDESLLTDIRKFIESIPKIESHYTRQSSTREYIDGGKTIVDLFRDFKEAQYKNQ